MTGTVSSLRVDDDLEMTTRDGVVLRSNVVRPAVDGPVPAVVIRTPYNKNAHASTVCPPLTLARAGFAVVIQDVRGRFASDGDRWPPLDLWSTEGDDGWDCLEWVADQPWCDGNIGMAGASYLAEVQYALASRRPPQLKALAPAMHTIGSEALRYLSLALESAVLTYGAGMVLDTLTKRMHTGEVTPEHFAIAMSVLSDPAGAAAHVPVSDHPLFSTPGFPTYAEVRETVNSTFSGPLGRGEGCYSVPALLTTGWYDSQLGSVDMFDVFRRQALDERARDGTRLIIGAWTHNYQMSFVGEWGITALGSAEGAFVPQAHVDFFRRHLRGEHAVPNLPVVRYFLTGTNEWRTGDDWPLPDTSYEPLYLRSGGRANGLAGDGRLSWQAPASGEAPDSFDYDPSDPAPSIGGRVMYTGGSTLAGPFNQSRAEQRADVLVYTSEVLRDPVEVAGPVVLQLSASSSAVDTDFHAKLCDVSPDGASVNVADGMLRTAWREGWAHPQLLEPGRPYDLKISLGATGHVFRPGHRIRVTVTSSGFPHWERNMNTGNAAGSDAHGPIAHQTVFHDDEHPSFVVLPVQSR